MTQLISTMQDSALTITAMLRHGQRVYATSVVQTVEGDTVRSATYAQVGDRATRLAGALAGLGVRPGDRVGTLMWNTQEHLEVAAAGDADEGPPRRRGGWRYDRLGPGRRHPGGTGGPHLRNRAGLAGATRRHALVELLLGQHLAALLASAPGPHDDTSRLGMRTAATVRRRPGSGGGDP